MKKCYVAHIEQYEINNFEINIILDALTRADFDELNEENVFDENYLSSIETNLFDITLSAGQVQEFNLDSEEVSWVEFSITNSKTDIIANLYHDIYFGDDFEKVYIKDIKPTSIVGKTKLYSMEIFEETNASNILDLIKNIRPADVMCYNVGQGNCNGICNSNKEPLVYFDFGGGVYGNSKTYPYNRKTLDAFSFKLNPLIILSHWDWDHMASVKKAMHLDAKNLLWLAPKQAVGITHLKFAIELYNEKNLLLWPENFLFIKSNYIEIQKINTKNKRDKNNNGLVVIVTIVSKEDNHQYTILLPADASYSHVDLSRYDELNGLVATHHGASSDNCLIEIPKASFHNILVYSYGEHNTFGHPKDLSKEKHEKQGWHNSKHTTSGDVLMKPEPMKIADIIESI